LSAVQLGWRVVVKLQIANAHTSQKANENFHSRSTLAQRYLRVETRLPPIVIEGRAGISYNLVFVQ
jgi:hypothetical protein